MFVVCVALLIVFLLERRKRLLICFGVCSRLHLALSQLYSNKQLEWNKAVITQREREVLNWLKQGKSSWDMSVILGVSERTVNYHVNNIRKKLGATNRPQALALAARRGLIEFS